MTNGDEQQRAEKALALLRGDHFDVPKRKALTADMVAAGARLVVWQQFGSTAMLQRRLRISFSLAGQVVAELERYDVVGPKPEGTRQNPVLRQQNAAHEVFTWLTGLWRPSSEAT